MDPEKIAKIRALAERGATEGERAAARAALERMGASSIPLSGDPPGVTGFGHITFHADLIKESGYTSSEIIDMIMNDDPRVRNWFGGTFVQSKAPHHRGRVWFDTSG